ncbi:virion RNA polymerase [Escherichia phage St11Ph5]|uniref:Virion RNA polymerase n=1 Tax=Escherichia phage St11Ph5 TaxID=2047765 RepID=A0A2D2W307_9CAUD|nr:virion RNA polymerase [Escherichia phage St11Ph5]ATS92525.1 virion RNA polymerase [Escherichia phage St11Ph5]
MSTFDRLAGFADSITTAKQVDVSTATSRKQAEQGQNPFQLTPQNAYQLQAGRTGNLGAGAFDPGSIQADFTNASPLEIINKYGNEQGMDILNARVNAANAVRRDLTKSRTYGEALGDTLSGVGLGVANTLGGIAALGTGLVNDNAGASIASGLDWLNKGVHNLQSDALNARRNVVQNQNVISAQENEKLYKQDIAKGESELVASLSRIGRDAYDSVVNTLSNGMAATDGLAEGVGSLFTGGPLIRGVSALGKVMVGGDKAVKGITLAAELGSRPAQVALATGRVAAPAIAIGGMEAGGAYQQTANEIMEMPFSELAAKSPVYQQHIKDGLSPEEARRQTASETGITAAGLTAPVAALTGPLVSKFELNPLKVGSLAGAGSNMLRETVEEGIQSGTSQLAQNKAIQGNVDAKRDLLKGVGEQTGLGALYGFGSAGVAQAPGATVKAAGAAVGPAVRTTMAAASLAGNALAKAASPITNILVQRGEEVAKRNEQASPVSDATVNAAAQEATAQAEQAQATVQEAVDAMDISPEEKAAATQYAADLTQAMKFDPVELEQASPAIREAVSGSTNRVEAIQKMADLVNTAEDPNVQMEAAIQMYDNIMSMDSFINRDPGALANLEQGSPAANIVDQFSGLMANVQNTPKVLRAFRAIHSMIQEQAEAGKLKATEEANQAQANNIAMAADMSPEVLDADSVNMVLKHASEGKITLGNRQRAALQSAAALLQGAREFDAKAEELGLRPQDIVSKQIKTDESRSNEGQYSALQHAKRIRSAYNSGNFDLASAYLDDFMKFAQHMQNKVGALNEHLISGNADKNKSVHYQALTPSREWVRSRTGLGVNPYDTKSVKFAQQVGLEAKTVADIANALATAYPELNVSHVKVTPLDSRLNKPAAQVVKEFRQGNLDAAQSQQTNEPVNQVDEAPVTKQEPVTPTVQTKPSVSEAVKTEPTIKESKPQTVKEPENQSEKQDIVEQPTESERDSYVKENTISQDTLNKYGDRRDSPWLFADGTVVGSNGDHISLSDVFGHDGYRDMSLDTGAVRSTFYKGSEQPFVSLQLFDNQKLTAEQFNTVQSFVEANNALIQIGVDTSGLNTNNVEKEEVSLAQLKADYTVGGKPLSGMEAVFPVYNNEKTPNQFLKAFSLPEEPKSRTIGSESPLTDVNKALSSAARFEAFTQKENNALTSDVIKRYQDLFEFGETLKTTLSDRLTKFLANKNVGKRFAEGTEANRWVGGKLLNIVEKDGDTFKFNDQLLETAVLAGLQWRLTATQNAAIKDMQDVAAITGVNASLLPEGILAEFENAQTLVEATNSLAQKIESYWGLNRNADAPLGYTKGIPMAMATEILSSLIEMGEVKESMLDVSEIDPESNKTIGLYTIEKLDDTDAINKFPTAIEEAVLVEPVEKLYFGDDIPPVAHTQLRNPAVRNTPEQKAALKAEQATEFFVHTPMVQFYEALGKDRILELMGAGTLDKDLLNKNHAKSLEGKNRSVEDSYNQLFSVIEQVRAQSEDISTVPIHYAYNMTRVGRMQMLGKYNPQSAKLVREAILPTKATLDLSNQNNEDFSGFQLGLAQALGIKVHKMTRETMSEELTKALEGKLKPAVDMMVEFDKSGYLPTDAVDILRTSLGNDKSFVALMALMEYARYLNSDDRANFNTPLYVEADGVTNGPINAMVLMTGGKFTPNWIKNTAKGGLFFGKAGKTMNEHHTQEDSVDLYEASTNSLQFYLNELRNAYSKNIPVINQMDHLQKLMDLFIKDFNLKEDGTLDLKRGIAKNPLTITIYGSGARGIAGKMVSAITDTIYERLSDVLKARAVDPNISPAMAMFGKEAASEADAQAMLDTFLTSMKALTGNIPAKRKGKLFIKEVDGVLTGKLDPREFTVSGDALKNLQENMLHFFVEPMRQSIRFTVGEGLMQSTENLQKATQIQSLVLQDMFQQAVQAKLAEKEKDPTWKKGDFLTQKELNEIQNSLAPLAPMIETGSQTFYIAGSENTDVANQVLATNLDDRMRVPMSIYAPSQAGVAGIPFMTIGTGDGMMMQTLSTMKGAPKNTLKIFDGMNIGINDITDASRKANEAVYTSWQGNPIKNVYESFSKFAKNVDLNKLSDAAIDAIAKSALDFDQRAQITRVDGDRDYKISMIKDSGIALIERNLRNIALGVDIRHKVMDQVQVTVDQMAAVGAPYVNNGKISLEGLTVDQQVAKLNELFDAELNKRRDAVRAAKAEPVKEVPAMEQVGRVLKSGVRLLSNTAITKLAKEMSPEQQEVLKEIQKSLAAKDYKVVYGTPSQLDAYAIEKNITRPAPEDIEAAEAGNAYGWTNFEDKTIYLVTPSLETLVHELVHASTFESVLAHYEGTPNEAVQNIEDLMNQFRALDVYDESPAVREAYADALNTINGHLSNGFIEPAMAKAAALNEYMAWGLTNRELINKQKKTTALKTMVQAVYEAIKRLVFGRKKAPANADDMFSGLLFNSAVVMRGQAPTATVAKDTTLFHNKAYGNNTRLEELGKTFDKLITNYIGSEPVQQVIRKGKFSDAVVNATKVTRDVQAHGFTMNMQEQRLFTNIVAALATEAAINPAALARAQEYYTHVTKNLTVEVFMADPDSTNPADRYYAQQKFDTIMGANNIEFDAHGRSSLLPTFVGLAMVSEEVRKVLADIPVMKADKKSGNTVDAMLTNIGTAAMASLNARVAGDTKATNVQEGMDALAQTIMQTSLNAESFYDSVATPTGNAIDRANQYLVDSIDVLSTRALEGAREVAANTKNPLVKGAAHAAQLIAAIATEKNGSIVAEGVMAAMNQGKVWQPFHDLVNDIIGRTKSNASVYDLIKAVRAQVQADRQQFREHLPTTIASKFSRKLTNEEWKAMHTGMGKTDLAVLRDTMSLAEIRDLLTDQKIVDREVNKLEADLQKQAGRNWSLINRKSKQLAQYMINGTVGNNLLRNATAISRLLGERKTTRSVVDVAQLDKLITLYALEAMNKTDREMLSSLAQTEIEGMDFATSYLVGQRKDEMAKAKSDSRATLNQYKGYIPGETKQGVNLIVAEDSQFADLIEKSYVRLGTYQGSSANRGPARSYYFAPVQAQAPFSQGILQNVRNTAGGVDLGTGFTMGTMVAGRITDKPSVDRVTKALARGERGNEPLLPVYDANGNVVAYEQSIDPNMLKHIEGENHLARAIGVWRGRQVEEAKAQRFNDMLIENLHSMYENDIKMSASNKSQYVNLLGSKLDPVTADALKLMNSETRQKAESLFGPGELWVRRDMLNDALGYRAASVGDAWSGNSRWSPETLDTFKKAMLGVFGNRAYKYVMGGENLVQNLVKEAKTLIVVKSVVVPAVNFLANLYQMVARGVPVKNIAKSIPQKTAEINQYLKSRLRQVDAEAELRAATNPNQIRKLKAEIQSITDSHKRLSIWPLLEAGEFSSIADAGIGRDDILITEGKIHEYMDKLADKLPKSVRNAGRYALITKDTALFQGIQKTVEYSDFIAKAIIYDELTQRKGKTREEALGRVTEEFINYDRLPGRFRGYMESVGLMWFYNFKIRSAKVAVSMIRNNPVHAAMAMLAPTPTMFGNVGLPIQDNIFSIAAQGNLGYSFGLGQGLRAHTLNPWLNLTN